MSREAVFKVIKKNIKNSNLSGTLFECACRVVRYQEFSSAVSIDDSQRPFPLQKARVGSSWTDCRQSRFLHMIAGVGL
jgi:hypothetical protein